MSGSGYTKFNDYSHAELRKMAQALNPGEVMAASDPWRRAADTLKAIRATLTRASTEAAVSWEGSTSDAFHKRMLQLAATINNASSYANDAANTLKHLSEAISQAKRDMPEEPSGWEQFTDGVGDTVSSIFGGDDEDTKTAVAEQKKAEAAAVMQTLAMHYRVATPMLKPPPSYYRGDDVHDVTAAPSDPSAGAPALSAVMAGIGYTGGTGTAPTASGGSATPLGKAAERPAPKPAVTKPTPTPPRTDSGIKGGTAQAAPKPPSVTNYGPGTAIDGTTITPSSTPATSPLSTNTTNPTSNPGTPIGLPKGGIEVGPGPAGGGPILGGKGGQGKDPGKGGVTQNKDAFGRTTGAPGKAGARGGKAFGVGEGYEGGFGTGGRAATGARPGSALPGRTGGIVGGGARPGGGSGAKQAFTEGGSGLGARGRARGELGTNSGAGMGPGMPIGDSQRRKKDKEKDGKRPDYLVEDEETWASDKPANPNVVE
ncbi:WXG100 family type VII secretion target [Kitasatospora sp. NPDC050467]|uniref:WXG100 family type VII secretion target n=1 Tax=Kitasatospora sp. NPDC050467 TaxID=3364053 RepID=UPI0037A7843C